MSYISSILLGSGLEDSTLIEWEKTPWVRKRDEVCTLQEMSIKCIIEHYERFLTQAKDTNPFEKLSNSLRNMVMAADGMNNYNYRICGDDKLKMQQLLVNKSTSKLELRCDPDEENPLLETMVALRPQLKHFKLKVDFPEEDEMDSDDLFEILMPDHFFEAILSFAELEELDISRAGCLCNGHLKLIANNLKNLKCLLVNLDYEGISYPGLKKLAKLQHLREVQICGNAVYPEPEIGMRHKLLRAVPKLHKVNFHDLEIDDVHRNDYGSLNHDSLKFSLLPKTPIQLGLKELILYNTAAQIPPNVTMLNLESLFLFKVWAFAPSTNFNKVSILCLGSLGMETTNEILGHLGHQLQKLNIMKDKGTLYLDHIAKKCPILEEFYLPSGPPVLSTYFGDISFAHLKTFTYNVAHKSEPSIAKFEPGVLLQLLSGAPNLKNFGFKHVELNQMEVDELVNELKQGRLLQNLETFWYNTLKLGGNEAQSNLILRTRKCYETLAEEMKLSCPCLQSISGSCW